MALKSFEETERSFKVSSNEDSVMKTSDEKFKLKCFSCGKLGHKRSECRYKNGNENKSRRWCEQCKSATHDTSYCRKINSSKLVCDDSSDNHSFAFKASHGEMSNSAVAKTLLVDCGATSHIITDESKFINFDSNFNSSNHYIELADGSRSSGIISMKGDALVSLFDINGNSHNVLLCNALCIPSYKQNIFSVQAATQKGASVIFDSSIARLKTPDGTIFDIQKLGNLYYLNSIHHSKQISRSLYEWHKILGHCNFRDILDLENVVNGMKIDDKTRFECSNCTLGKMSQTTCRKPDKRAEHPCLLYTSPSPRDKRQSRMPSSA